MAWYHAMMISAALFALVSSWQLPRARLWIGAGAFSYASSALWHNYGLPYPVYYGAATNLVLCYLLWIFAQQRYEMRVWNAVHLMLVLDLLYLTGFIRDKIAFAVSLEIVNLVALALISLTGIMERCHVTSWADRYTGWRALIYKSLWAERSRNSKPWWGEK